MAVPLRIDKKNFIPAHTNSFPCEKDGMKGKVSTFACSMHKLIKFIKKIARLYGTRDIIVPIQ